MWIIWRIAAALVVVGALGFFLFAPAYVEGLQNPVTEHAPWPVSPAAQAMHERLVIGDWHADSLLWDRDLTKRAAQGPDSGNLGYHLHRSVYPARSGQGIVRTKGYAL